MIKRENRERRPHMTRMLLRPIAIVVGSHNEVAEVTTNDLLQDIMSCGQYLSYFCRT